MALFRALETARPSNQRLFADPLAARFLRPSLRVALTLARLPVVGRAIPGLIDRRWPGARTSGVARTRMIDDLMAEAFRAGFGQIVILGAGFDSRAYRLSPPPNARFFEVDQPSTSQRKQRIIKDYQRSLPAHVTFVQIDLNHQELGPVLESEGFRRDPTFFVWEGVTNYLSAMAVDATVRWVGSCAQSSRIVFTYVHKDVIDAPTSFAGTEGLGKTLARTGERWTFGLDPGELKDYLAAGGLELIEDLGAGDYRSRYIGTPDSGYEFYRVVTARVRGTP